jgi:hypothetical protein
MKEQAMTTMITTEEKDREALARRMYDAIVDELVREDDRAVEEIFDGRGPPHVLLGAIADLAESLICSVAWAYTGSTWQEMVGEVHGEMLKWVQHLEDC